MRLPRIVIAAPGSGSGKTLVSIALMKALSGRGKKVAAFKCGPDYIDPLFHKKIPGVPSKNLDLFFTDEDTTRQLFCDGNESDISVIEGVMGLYDGIAGFTETASTYHLASVLESPVILVVNARGAGRSVIAQIKGFVAMDKKHLIKGVILNNMTENLYGSLKPDIEAECDVTVLGFVPTMRELNVESRYLGLTLPDEINDIQQSVEKAAAVLSKNVDVDKIIEIADSAPGAGSGTAGVGASAPELPGAGMPSSGVSAADFSFVSAPASSFAPVRIAVAQDGAFCFYYDDNLKLLQRFGAELVPFSPVADEVLPPDIDGLLLGGGYPELYAEKLEQNASMRNAIKSAIIGGLPSLAECGGFMYLHERIQSADGVFHSMAGVIKDDCTYSGKSVRFGYCTVTEDTGAFFGAQLKAHEFHYFDSTSCGESCTAEKPVTGRSWKCCHTGVNHWWGFPHLYYASNPHFAERFVERCRAYRLARKACAAETATSTDASCAESRRDTANCANHAENPTIAAAAASGCAGCAETPVHVREPAGRDSASKSTTKNYKFFQNRVCEMFPCHKTDDPENFNCLFCFCPLYFSGEKCGGNFHYTEKGRKSCIDCTFPHKKENYDALMEKIRVLLK
jgi:cobyrinic acid a,c-diamide synthase